MSNPCPRLLVFGVSRGWFLQMETLTTKSRSFAALYALQQLFECYIERIGDAQHGFQRQLLP